MDLVQAGWMASLVSAGWLLPVGAIRMLAYRTGEVDHTPGMRFVAVLALSLGAVAVVVFLVLSAVLLTR